MAKAIKTYDGGINFRVQAAVRTDGALFIRTQNKGRYGYAWGAWRFRTQLDTENLPGTIQAGFANLYPTNFYTAFNPRLPNGEAA